MFCGRTRLKPRYFFAAIVGGGIGGTACASYLSKLFADTPGANVTVFELGVVGGRLATVTMAGHEYEVGGSIIHPANRLMKELTAEAGLREKPKVEKVGKWQVDRFSFHSFGEVVFVESKWSYAALLQLVWRYGYLNLSKMQKFISELLTNFGL